MTTTAGERATLTRRRAERPRALWSTDFVQRYVMIGLLVALIALFSALRPQTFASSTNAQQLINNQSVVVIIAMSAMVTLVVGCFDLSITATMSLASTLAVGLQASMPWPAAVAIALSAGLLIGVVNGVLVGYLKLGSFVTTLGTQVIVGGVVIWYTGGQVLFSDLQGSFLTAGRGGFAGLVYPIILALVLAAVLWMLYEYTPLGRAMYAVGSSSESARLSGLPANRLILTSFAIGGVLAALAGAVVAAKIGSGQPDVGASYLLPAFASAFLGASVIRPGQFNAAGTLVGVYIVAVGFTGLALMGVALWVQPIFYGITLLAAVAVPALLGKQLTWPGRRRSTKAATTPSDAFESPAGGPGARDHGRS